MIASHAVARAALRCSSARHFWSSRAVTAAVGYHSYPLPSATPAAPTTAPPRNDDAAETSITSSSEPLPKVHETRPPPSHEATPPSVSSAASSSTTTTTSTTSTTRIPPPRKASEVEAEAQKTRPVSRPRPKLRARKAAIKLTPSAVVQLRTLLDGPEPRLIRVGVRNRGCSGLAYHLDYVEDAGKFDEVVEQDGVRVLIDSKALFSIIGSEMDWAEDKLNQRFVFKNPNIKEECGCGESFMV